MEIKEIRVCIRKRRSKTKWATSFVCACKFYIYIAQFKLTTFTCEFRSSTPRLMSMSRLVFCFTSPCKASWICRSFIAMSLASTTLSRGKA